ncbi:hypothetical protein EJ357_47705 [Streptomyces cyaneochromogenes]|uniref:Uncharacterized protein n=1 Tax=Streptomyces cyaneochromogenes TaxID=2496836 RepID=A0A3S9LZ57_9ACTN|nr:hypothetical protein [Streptomyces cyaneochromogenes]AZQ32110.1 hypothetical protein EJ357_00225 [Streptomyces cyaneochromogenes]AZQ40113.1 hypothetical protein EJ357_47705 [Streptomyces cyaneochromogenes]
MDASWHDVFVTEGTFGLLDDGEIPVHSADWSNGLIAPMLQGGALVRTGIQSGYVRVSIRALREPAEEIDESRPWEEIVEAAVTAPRNRLRLESLDYGPPAPDMPLTTADTTQYRLRVHARGRDAARSQSAQVPREEYLLLVWPAEPAPTRTLRGSNRLEEEEQAEAANPHPPRMHPAEPPEATAEREIRARLDEALRRSRKDQ